MTNILTDTVTNGGTSARQTRPLSPKAAELLNDRNGNLPCWVRSPKIGAEYFTGFSRAKLYELAGKSLIRSVSIREAGQVKGTRLFNLASILAFIEKCERKRGGCSGGTRGRESERIKNPPRSRSGKTRRIIAYESFFLQPGRAVNAGGRQSAVEHSRPLAAFRIPRQTFGKLPLPVARRSQAQLQRERGRDFVE